MIQKSHGSWAEETASISSVEKLEVWAQILLDGRESTYERKI